MLPETPFCEISPYSKPSLFDLHPMDFPFMLVSLIFSLEASLYSCTAMESAEELIWPNVLSLMMPFEIRDAGEVNVALIVFADVVMTRESLILRNDC